MTEFYEFGSQLRDLLRGLLSVNVPGQMPGQEISQKKLSVYSSGFPTTPIDNEMWGATTIRLVLREERPDPSKPWDDAANQPSEEIKLACLIAGRWGIPGKLSDARAALPQEIYSVNGWGYSNILGGPIQFTLNPGKRSLGMTVQASDKAEFPAKGYFDMFVQITKPDDPNFPVLENREAIRIVALDVAHVPPLGIPFAHKDQPVALHGPSGKIYAWHFEGQKNLVRLLEQKPSQRRIELGEIPEALMPFYASGSSH